MCPKPTNRHKTQEDDPIHWPSEDDVNSLVGKESHQCPLTQEVKFILCEYQSIEYALTCRQPHDNKDALQEVHSESCRQIPWGGHIHSPVRARNPHKPTDDQYNEPISHNNIANPSAVSKTEVGTDEGQEEQVETVERPLNLGAIEDHPVDVQIDENEPPDPARSLANGRQDADDANRA
jgi:hypothetical protein